MRVSFQHRGTAALAENNSPYNHKYQTQFLFIGVWFRHTWAAFQQVSRLPYYFELCLVLPGGSDVCHLQNNKNKQRKLLRYMFLTEEKHYFKKSLNIEITYSIHLIT